MFTSILLTYNLDCSLSPVRFSSRPGVYEAAGDGWSFPPGDKVIVSNNYFLYLSSFF